MARLRPDAELTTTDHGFLRGGRPHQIISAAIHYFRVHPELWEDRLRRLRAMGVNTIETYIAWNLHQPTPDRTDFSGQADITRFIRTAAHLDLDVIVRPGPYICAEWEFGGLPAWLLADPTLRLRRSDPRYLAAVDAWFDQLVPVLRPLLAGRGGRVVAVQIENEYGSYGTDTAYLDHLRQGLRQRGVDCLLFTADGPTDGVLRGGILPGTLATATFGSQPEEALDTLRRHQPAGPLMCSEYWHGWFDHWGEHHHVRDPREAGAELDRMLSRGASVNLYMGHGGTNFGWWNGANRDESDYRSTCTSYDYDAPVGEAGELTEKFHVFREVIERYRGPIGHEAPAQPARLAPQTVGPSGTVALLNCLDELSTPHHRLSPEPMEALGQSLGLIHYRTRLRGPFPESTLRVHGLADRAQVFLDGEPIGLLERDGPLDALAISVPGTGAQLDLLVENMGRVNYGPWLEDRKGISGGVRIDTQYQSGWEIRPLPLTDPSALRFGAPEAVEGPAFHRAEVEIPAPADGFLALPGWTKGQVWLNGFALGRYWDRGPQRTLYAPAPVWRADRNELVILELHRPGERIEILDTADLGPQG
ncbi:MULTISPECIES: beta-galactosidase family protein [unclassified Streptomyces]|uniref:glycoside hydrolase family 35 protein n=1 Tax=unclassified Streptomyces TaxID=2593676 RepID=UPI002255BA36|nr:MULTISPECIES: beta-galactosidase family protein [unclassified Streptomyces]MCX4552882.1 beta-galactosidase [Streptomyces sp. NBC_01500]WSC24212.1 beta-galactosidase [Streptomyces sp. NBC_01766]